ncbi:rhomboid family intramembrane serine protease [Luteolibacter flavescens]|uniref:Rhomboid family intramembrane serine protease n=1 Tax=Luteolibacter flavescens TaxID=1859460 RepID=A0ABT3FIK2_9BACT|nr:rhomboid family intramembrane serine protease [Luteolibacter flavescens]MCW1883398.1 rhomboid family intramembrane serine protease [Luteolibacter flavescens]
MDENASEETLPDLVPVGAWHSLREAQEHALVVLAMNRECWIFPASGQYALLAPSAEEPGIRHEFALYESEQSQRRERIEPPVFPAGLGLAFLWALSLLVVFLWQGRDPGLVDRFLNSSQALVEHGEWWRAFTALFLHADAGHLLSNIGIGGIFCVMVAHTVGAWRGWALILAGGTLGNLANAWARYPDHFNSLGASTATFAAVGVLTGVAMMRAWRLHSWRELRLLTVPLLTGFIVLGLWGSGGGGPDAGRVDVAGHFSGWASGLLLGAVAQKFERTKSDASV